MSLYQFSKSKITGLSASLLVLIALLTAFANIFHVVPPSLGLAVSVVRWVLAGTLVFVWVILNIPPPKLPSGNYIIALAQFGEEQAEGGAQVGLLRAQRRYRLRREDLEDYIDDDEAVQPTSKEILRIRRTRSQSSRGVLNAPRPNEALPAGQRQGSSSTALALSERKLNVATSEMPNLTEFLPTQRSGTELAFPSDTEDDTVGARRNDSHTLTKFTPPPNLWKLVSGGRAVTEYVDQNIKQKLTEVGVHDVSIYPTDTFVGDGEIAMQQAEAVRAHAVIWGWVPYHSRRDFVPIFELVKAVEDDIPAPGEMQLMGLNSFELGRQTTKFSTIFAAFVAGLGAYAVKKANRTEREQNLAKAENEFGLALTAAYMYSEERRTPHNIDLSIIYFFLGNVRYYRGNMDGAAVAYREVLALDPRMLEARHNLSVVLYAQNKVDLAIKFFSEVVKRKPELPAVHYNLGMAYIKKQQYPTGRRELNNAIRLNSKYAAAYRALGLSYREERAFDEAKAYLQEAAHIKPDYAQAHIDLAVTCYREARSDTIGEAESVKLYREATQEIEKAIQIDPTLPEAHYNLALFLYEQQEIDPAAEALKEALRLNPDYSEAHLLLSEIYRYRGQNDLADYHARQATRQSDMLTATSPEQHMSLGIGYRQNQQFDRARQEFESVLKLQPTNAAAQLQLGILYQEMGDLNQALLRYQVVMRLPNPPDEVYNQISSLYKQQGDDEGAFEVVKRAAELNPNSARLQYYLGNAYRKQKQDGRAIECYVNAIRLNPLLAESRFNLGMLYLGRKQVQDAVFQFREVVRLRPDDFETYSFLGRAYQQMNQIDASVAALQEAIRIRPDAVEAHLSLGQIYVKSLAVPEPELAIEQFQQVLSYRPDNVIAREFLGRAYAQSGKLDMAINTFESIIVADPQNSAAHYNLGVAFTSQERFQLAIQEFETYVRLKPDDADGYFNLGLAYNQLDRVTEAIASFKKAVQLRPTYCAAYNYLGQVYIRINENAAALEALNMYQRCKNGGN